ncbi:MAG: membrane dipeptidase [Hyphomicrobiales bacterium]|nr:membrane dipeptidase [Hyphomicrobiales bacterium]MCP5001880.1 membrane dipeptidase [Hyphomicrobiales bacterium]
MTPSTLVFDGHNDVLTRLYKAGGIGIAEGFLTGQDGHIDLPKAKMGGFGGGFFAIWIPTPEELDDEIEAMEAPQYDIPLPESIEAKEAIQIAIEEAAILCRLEELGALKICVTATELRDCLESGKMAAILHMEGAEAIDPELHALEVFYRAGLRSLGPVWSRPTIFGEGVPFRFPGSPDIGGGLTGLGLDLVRRCNALGIMIDLSHITERGFWDVAEHSTHPLVATHSNAHALCPHVRNLTDDQLGAIAGSDGMVGVNFAASFLREDGRMIDDVPLEQMLRHFDHLISLVGEDRVGFGSDFDGAKVPQAIGDASGLRFLVEAMRNHGYDEVLLKKLCHGNWLRVLEKTWGK